MEGAYRPGDGDRFREPPGRKRRGLVAGLVALGDDDGPVEVPGPAWAWAFGLRSLGGHWGWLVVTAPAEPTADERFLLKVLAHQTGSALENAALHRRERAGAAELRRVNAELGVVNEQLAATVADLERTATIHEALTRASAFFQFSVNAACSGVLRAGVKFTPALVGRSLRWQGRQ